MKFRVLLRLMGTLLAVSSRVSRAVQQQVSHRRVIEIGSDDGVIYHYTFHNRRISFGRGPAENPSCAVRFATARQGFRTLTAANRFALFVEEMHEGTVHIRGDVALFLWFEGLLGALQPARRAHAPDIPSSFTSPPPTREAEKYVTREPETTELDPAWTSAATQRKKLVITRVPAGEPLETYN